MLIAFALLALIVADSTVDSWTVVRFFGGLRIPGAASAFHDPIFNKPLRFYFLIYPSTLCCSRFAGRQRFFADYLLAVPLT